MLPESSPAAAGVSRSIGIPHPAEQAAFLADTSPDADEVVDRLLASEQHGVRYARHWLDVLRYSDIDDTMAAASGIHYWRDWVITSLNEDLPYDKFVRANRPATAMANTPPLTKTATGAARFPGLMTCSRGFPGRGQVVRDGQDTQELPTTAVETLSTAFMGITVGCAKCHDHKFDPITRQDYYAMSAVFEPLVVKRVRLATAEETDELRSPLHRI